MNTAQIIADQIGGRAFLMLGTKGELFATENGLQFTVRGSRAVNKVRVTLAPSDTYTVEFFKSGRNFSVKTVATETDVYADSLHAVIEKHTGLYTSL